MPQLSDIARKAKVSVSTVSLALRNRPQITAATRERVLAAAKALGYQANPLISAYQANVRSGRQQRYRGTIAWIDDTRPGDTQNQSSAYREMQRGAKEQAAAQGFALDVLSVPDIDPNNDEGNRARMERVMVARGIVGAIFPPLWWARMLTYDWSSVAVAAYGGNAGFVEKYNQTGFSHLRYTHVLTDVYHDTRLALAHLRELGYRRIALITSCFQEIGASYRYTAARHAFSSEYTDMPLIKSWVSDDSITLKPSSGFRSWLRTARPDAVVSTLGCARDWLSACGVEAPRDIGLAHPFLGVGEEGWSGVRENYVLVGRTLLDASVAQVLRGERGMPAYPKSLVLIGNWEAGSTTRPVRPGA
ncbi:MAG: LacI family DNA-binding transcriptional regulator [Burkholderiales bacterium]|nr:LacI family DNA-binding transcriptional regulator [Opitutaceae bacterium]